MFRWLDPILNPLACLPPAPEIPIDKNAQSLLARLEAILQHQLKYAFTGEKRSLLRGQGLDFADLREYTPGDDIRKIDWNVFARTLSPHIREYQEEKQLTLWLVLDCTGSMHFGKWRTKFQLMTELAGLFALMAERSGHRLGAVLIQDANVKIIPPKTGMGQVQFILDRMLNGNKKESIEQKQSQDMLLKAFQQLTHLAQKHSTIVVFSDFLSTDSKWRMPLGQLSRHSKLIHAVLEDPVEKAIPVGVGLLSFIDPETRQITDIDTSNLQVVSEYQAAFQKQQSQTHSLLEAIGTVIHADTTETVTDILLRLMRQPPTRKRVS